MLNLKSFMLAAALVAVLSNSYAFAGSEPAQSGFLSSYAGFKDGPDGGVDKIWTNPNFQFPKDLARFNAFYFDPIAVHLSKEGAQRGVNVMELAELANKLRSSLITELKKGGYMVVTQPGSGVLRFMIALTDVEPSNAVMDTITSIVPFARVFSFIKSETGGEHSFVGSASVEGVIIDGLSGETLIAFVDKQSGDKGIFGGVDSMEDVNDAFIFWSTRLRKVLDQAHGK